MTNLYKKIASAIGIVAVLGMPFVSQASVLGIATSGDISSIQNQINAIQAEIDTLTAELANTPSSGNLGSQLPSSPALVDTYLAAGIGTTDTSMVLANGQTSDGVTLAGYMCFTIDVNTPQLEYACGNASGTAVTGMTRGLGFWNPNTTSSALAFTHRRFASVQSTDYPTLQLIVRQLTAVDGVSSTNPLFYDHTEICNSPLQICPKSYIDGVASSGAADASPSVKGLVIIGTPTSAPTSTDGASVLYSIISSQYYSSISKGATTTVVLTTASGTIDPSLLSAISSYNVGGITSASTTLSGNTTIGNGTTTIAGINVTSTSFSKFGGTGAQGVLSLSGTTTSTINLNSGSVVIENYTSISITGSSSLLFSNPATNGSIVILKSQGNCTLTSSAASGTIVVSNLGATSANYGNSLSGGGPTSGYLIGGSFAQPGPSTLGFTTGFGGQGAHVAASSSFISGAFAGAGGGTGSFNGGAGGQGGGGLVIECGGSLNFTGTINAQGNVGAVGTGSSGYNGSYCSAPGGGGNADGAGPACSNTGTGTPTTTQGGGGGGGGSTIMLYNGTLVANTGTINVGGGAGGTGTHDNGTAGGAGYSYVGQNTEY